MTLQVDKKDNGLNGAALEQASLFISHGGINSVSESLQFSVPMLLVPRQFEQLNNALRVQELGAGRLIHKGQVSAARIRQEATLLLSDASYRQRAKEIAESFAHSGGSVRAVDEILAYVSRDRGGQSRHKRPSSKPVAAVTTSYI